MKGYHMKGYYRTDSEVHRMYTVNAKRSAVELDRLRAEYNKPQVRYTEPEPPHNARSILNHLRG